MKLRPTAVVPVAALFLLLAAGRLAPSLAVEGDDKAATRAMMQGIFASLRTAFVASLNEKQYESPKQLKEIQTALESLAANAGYLEAHGQNLNPSYDFLRRSLAADVREAARRYKEGEFGSSR
ncbi:MAG: hypothetical protein Q8R92_00575, partial [Deltaproteobacteria bacterium]|nr:hypothetical protein [Deltaproteobacteria bacterium]